MAAQYSPIALMYVRHVISIALYDPESSPLNRFNLVNLCFREQVIPNWGRIFQYRPDYPGVEMAWGTPARPSCSKK